MRINKCRICNNNKLFQIGSLESIAISNFTKTPEQGKTYPLEVDQSHINPDGFKWVQDYWENVTIAPADTIHSPNKFMKNITAHLKPKSYKGKWITTIPKFKII